MTPQSRSCAVCATCGEAVNLSRNNYRVIGLRVDPAWRQPDMRPEPPQSIYKHRFCMAADEWSSEAAAADADGAAMPCSTMLQGVGA